MTQQQSYLKVNWIISVSHVGGIPLLGARTFRSIKPVTVWIGRTNS